jgi:hypothetical protein
MSRRPWTFPLSDQFHGAVNSLDDIARAFVSRFKRRELARASFAHRERDLDFFGRASRIRTLGSGASLMAPGIIVCQVHIPRPP